MRTRKPHGMKAVALVGTCPNCGESVEVYATKKQLKAILKSMKCTTPAEAEKLTETILGRDKEANLQL